VALADLSWARTSALAPLVSLALSAPSTSTIVLPTLASTAALALIVSTDTRALVELAFLEPAVLPTLTTALPTRVLMVFALMALRASLVPAPVVIPDHVVRLVCVTARFIDECHLFSVPFELCALSIHGLPYLPCL
jgi:hypothetical protein